jgi:hypothetical protein
VTKPIVSRERLASETDRLRQAVNAYRAQKEALPSATSQQPGAEPPQAPKPKRRSLSLAGRPTVLAGWPLNPSPPAEIPDYGTMGRVQAIRHRQRRPGARLPITGEPHLIKRRDYELRTSRAAE